MRKEYNQEEIERILKQDASIPETVEQRFRTAYENLGLTDITSAAGRSHSGSLTESMRHRRKKKALLVIAAAAVLTMGLGITALAVNHFLNVNLVEEDGTLAYDVSVNTEEKEAHLVTAEPTYVPEGYVYHPEEGPCMVGSLTGAVASQRVTEARKGWLRLVGNQSLSAMA